MQEVRRLPPGGACRGGEASVRERRTADREQAAQPAERAPDCRREGRCVQRSAGSVGSSGSRVQSESAPEPASESEPEPEPESAPASKSNDVCPSDDPLIRIAQLGHPNPDHHR